MTDTLARWDTLVNNFVHQTNLYWLLRERRLIALALFKGATLHDIYKIVDPSGIPVTRQGFNNRHSNPDIKKTIKEIEEILK